MVLQTQTCLGFYLGQSADVVAPYADSDQLDLSISLQTVFEVATLVFKISDPRTRFSSGNLEGLFTGTLLYSL